MSQATLSRTLFETPRVAEYFSLRELTAMTGQPASMFATVAFKELLDNALDAGEAAGVIPEITIDRCRDGHRLRLTIGDNGGGMQPEAVHRLLNFSTRLSDKAVYRSPTRGLQGNALKTILGMPHAFGLADPVIIEAQGVRHGIRAWVDPAGELHVDHQEGLSPRRSGTQVTLPLPADQELSAPFWARAFSLFNPHASVRFRRADAGAQHAEWDGAEGEDSYHPVVSFPGEWKKCLPTDPTSPWWYSAEELTRLVFSHIAEARRGGRDLLLRDFVRQFRGLTGTAKAKAVCDRLRPITRLSEFERDPEAVAMLLEAMKAEARAPSPALFGQVGQDAFRARFEAWYGVRRFWYRKVSGEEGFPFTFEVALAETRDPGGLFSAINFSPTFEDPLAGTSLQGPKFSAYGVRGFLAQAHASPIPSWEESTPHLAAAVHLVCPSPLFLDRGKTRLQLPPVVAQGIADALWAVSRELYQEGERRRKDAARQDRQDRQRERGREQAGSLKEAVFAVLPEAVGRATGDGAYPVSARTLYYQVRPLIQRLTAKELDYTYFSQQLLTEYQEARGRIRGLYYDPRGVLYEPHGGQAVPLGTREVEGYHFPSWLYNKILYVEKRGLWPVLQAARLAERYDLAVIAAEGYATEACRTLFRDADQSQGYQLLVLHDADIDGYNIARTLREETRRMPGYRVDVLDLGLKIEDGIAMGLETEEATRKKALPEGLELSEVERQTFQGRSVVRNAWVYKRMELNTMSAPQLVAYVERKLAAAGATGKVIPPEDRLPALAEAWYQGAVSERVTEVVGRLLDLDTLQRRVAQELLPQVDLSEAHHWIERGLEEDPAASWREALDGALAGILDGYAVEMETLLRRLVRERIG